MFLLLAFQPIEDQVSICIFRFQDDRGSTELAVSVNSLVDDLLVARFYVSRDPSILDVSLADVNDDGNADIIDALRIAQFYVGIISYFYLPSYP